MASGIEVRVHERGVVCGDEVREDESVRAACALCGRESDSVAAVGAGVYACSPCLRERLEAMSVARWRMKELRPQKIPWGKVSG